MKTKNNKTTESKFNRQAILLLLFVGLILLIIAGVVFSGLTQVTSPQTSLLIFTDPVEVQAKYENIAHAVAKAYESQAGDPDCYRVDLTARTHILEVRRENSPLWAQALASTTGDTGCTELNGIVIYMRSKISHEQITALIYKEAATLPAYSMVVRDLGWAKVGNIKNIEGNFEAHIVVDGIGLKLIPIQHQKVLDQMGQTGITPEVIDHIDCTVLKEVDRLSRQGSILPGGIPGILAVQGCN